jgi:lysine 6-dehydrogenase
VAVEQTMNRMQNHSARRCPLTTPACGQGAAPGFLGYRIMETIIEAGKDFVDVSAMEEDYLVLSSKARERGVTVVGSCGICPGLSCILVSHSVAAMAGRRCENCKVLVGGLPMTPRPPLFHTATWNVRDTLYQWEGVCIIRRGGRIVEIPTLEEPETVVLPGVPNGAPLEALATDGLGTLVHTIEATNMIEKTLRYPGTREVLRVLRDAKLFSTTPVVLPGNPQPVRLSPSPPAGWVGRPGHTRFVLLTLFGRRSSRCSSLRRCSSPC